MKEDMTAAEVMACHASHNAPMTAKQYANFNKVITKSFHSFGSPATITGIDFTHDYDHTSRVYGPGSSTIDYVQTTANYFIPAGKIEVSEVMHGVMINRVFVHRNDIEKYGMIFCIFYALAKYHSDNDFVAPSDQAGLDIEQWKKMMEALPKLDEPITTATPPTGTITWTTTTGNTNLPPVALDNMALADMTPQEVADYNAKWKAYYG